MTKNEVLSSTKFLTTNPQHVKVNEEALGILTGQLKEEDFFKVQWNFPEYISEESPANDVIDYFMLGNSINFAFQDFNGKGRFIATEGTQDFVGSGGMWFSIKRAYESGIPILEGNYLEKINKNEMQKIFSGNFEIPMLNERLKIFKEVGKVLNQKYGGHFYNLVQQSNSLFDNGNGLVEKLVAEFPSFNDSLKWRRHKVVFNKRAQLAPSMLYGRFQNTDICRFEDVDKLTVFADYVLPTGYRNLGVFEYSDELATKIDNGLPIKKGSLEELEMRAQTLHVSNRISEEINIPNYLLDTKLWSKTRKIKDLKFPLVKTIAY